MESATKTFPLARRGLAAPGEWAPPALVAGAALFLYLRFKVTADHPALFAAAVLAELAAVTLLARIAFSRLGAQHPCAEAARWTVLLCTALLLTLPYAAPVRVGAGDAGDYAVHIADFIAQAKHGVFPVLVGQSEYASNGAFNPLRTAPYLQYAGGALHALTLGTLDPFAVQNLAIILSLCAAGFSCYACLRRLSAGREWLCLILALLYVSSPGVLALVYAGDMVPSWLTLPYLPLYTYALVRIAEHGASAPRLFSLAAVTALLWSIHAPIAMWSTFIALPVVVLRLAAAPRGSKARGVLLAMGALLLFLVLAGYEFVSVAQLNLPTLAGGQLALFRGPAMYYNLRAGWAGLLRPVSAEGSNLIADLQLSGPLWACFVMGVAASRRAGWGLRALLIASCGLVILLAPLSAVAGRLWALMPAWVDQITDQWPMQRFYPILSAFAPFAGLLALGITRQRGCLRQRAAVLALALGCVWCGYEASKFIRRGFRVTLPADVSRRLIREENVVYAIYSAGMLGDVPRSYSPLPPAAEMQLRLLDRAGSRVLHSNLQSLLDGESGGRPLPAPPFVVPGEGQDPVLASPLVLPPGRNYLLTVEFSGAPPSGTLVVTGRELLKQYPLPAAVAVRPPLGGSTPNAILVVTVANPEGENVMMRFVPAAGSRGRADFARLSAVSYDPEGLPLHILGAPHFPLRIRARTFEAGWLVTPRIYIPGYRATVDGIPATVGRSSDGEVMVSVPSGESRVELQYSGSVLLRVSFWLCFAGWLLVSIGVVLWIRIHLSGE